ncbi:MAG: methyl-accepting chemotaxis protein [Bacteroidales bacterium]|nr:methyl-accepting chemotaxis protein [Bacteroidales bacterium]
MEEKRVFLMVGLNLVVAIPLAAVILRLFFKNSILYKIIFLWVTNLILIDISSKMSVLYPEAYPKYISLPLGLSVSIGLIYLTYKLVRKPFDTAISNLEVLSEGKLDVNYSNDYLERNDELGRIARSINSLTKTFKKVVTDIKNSSDFIATASHQLSSISQEISQGATEQASASEEVSASMEQMVANISQNADNAKQTEDIAQKASIGINKVGNSANNSLESIQQIAEKITIISDIAFQTNILAINAAIEAAAAGEHGKGFAVVANEVKKLAEKSKTAAEEINRLSESSVNVTIQTKEYMDKILPDIEKTLNLVNEITIASIEQNSGAEQINNAIQQLNLITQQSAANSEEMAGNSEELSAQAEKLKEIVSFFKFKN